MKRILAFLEQAVKILLIAAVVVWLADWALFRVKLTRAKAFDTVVVEQFLGTAFMANPYHRPTIGYASDLDSFSATDAEQFHQFPIADAGRLIAGLEARQTGWQ